MFLDSMLLRGMSPMVAAKYAEDLEGMERLSELASQANRRSTSTRREIDLGGGRKRTVMTGDEAFGFLERQGII